MDPPIVFRAPGTAQVDVCFEAPGAELPQGTHDRVQGRLAALACSVAPSSRGTANGDNALEANLRRGNSFEGNQAYPKGNLRCISASISESSIRASGLDAARICTCGQSFMAQDPPACSPRSSAARTYSRYPLSFPTWRTVDHSAWPSTSQKQSTASPH